MQQSAFYDPPINSSGAPDPQRREIGLRGHRTNHSSYAAHSTPFELAPLRSITSSSRASRRQTGAMLEAEAKFKGEKRQKQARF
jgi:hypothetical protein